VEKFLNLLDFDMTQTVLAALITALLGSGVVGYVFYSEVESVSVGNVSTAMRAHVAEVAPHPATAIVISELAESLTTLSTDFKVLRAVVDHNTIRSNEIQTENTRAQDRIEANQAAQTKLLQQMMLDLKKAH